MSVNVMHGFTTKKRSRTWPGRVLGAVGLGLTFVVSLLASVALHLDHPRARRLVLRAIESAAAQGLRGRVKIDGLSELRPRRARVDGATLFDVEGRRVIRVEGVEVRLALLTTIRSLVSGPLRVQVRELRIASAELTLFEDDAGVSLARALESPGPEAASESELDLELRSVRVERLALRGTLDAVPALHADLHGIRGAVRVADDVTAVDLATASVEARRLPVVDTLRGQVRGGLRLPAATSSRPAYFHGDYRGSVAGVTAALAGNYSPERLWASLALGPAAPDALSRLVPGVDFRETATLRLTAAGTPRDLAIEGVAELGRGRLALDARGRLQPEPSATASLDVRELSLASFGRALPETRLNAQLSTECGLKHGRLAGEFELAVPETHIADQSVPRIDARGTYSDSAATARVQIHEPGAPIDVDVDFHAARRHERGTEPGRLEFRAQSRADEVGQVARLAPDSARGRVELDARGRLTLSDPAQIDAELAATLRGVAIGPALVQSGRLEARASGALPDLPLEVQGNLNGVEIGQYRFQRADLEVAGAADALRVELTARGPQASSVDLWGVVDAGSGVAHELGASVRRDGDEARLAARRVELLDGGVEIEGLTVRGPGLALLDARLGSSDDRVESRGRGLDLARLAALAGIAVPVRSGLLSYDLSWRQERGDVRGRVAARLDELTLYDLEHADATVDLVIWDGVVDGAIWAHAGDLLALDARLDGVVLPRSLERIEDLSRVVGDVDLKARVDLAKLTQHVPDDVLPVERAEGTIALDLRAERASPALLPEIESRLVTERVRLVGKPRASAGSVSGLPWRIGGIDANAGLRIEPGGTTAFDARLHDGNGDWLRLAARTELPSRPDAVSAALRDFRSLPIELLATIPERDLATLPDVLRRGSSLGLVSAQLEARGTLGDPDVELVARGKRLRRNAAGAIALDVEGRLRHQRGRTEARVEVLEGEHRAAWLDGDADLDLAGMLTGEPIASLRASARAGADRFPLQALSLLSDRQISGRASGDLELVDLGRDARLATRIDVQGFGVGEVRFDEARVELRAGAERADLDAQLSSRDGSARLRAELPIAWGARTLPVADEARQGRARFEADELRAATLMPLVGGTLGALDGRIDAGVDATLAGDRSELRGELALRDGIVQIPALGQELSAVDLRLQAEPGGRVRLERLTARGATGRLEASGVAELRGLELREARLRAHIPRGRALPLTLEGVSYGDAHGDAEIRIARAADEDTMHVDVELPELTVELPEKTQHQIQSLDDHPRIRTGVYLSREHFATLPLERSLEVDDDSASSRVVTRVRLGKDVWIEQGTTLRVRLTGVLKLTSADDLTVDGEIGLRSGRLDVQGKEFRVEDGTVTFEGDPENPTIVATGVWQSPEAYRVYASFTGPLKSGNFRLRSDPPLQESEILSLLLFGTPDGQLGASMGGGSVDPSSAVTATAISVGGTTATRGLNRALTQLTSMNVQTRIDTGSGTATPEIAVQITRRLSAELGYNVGDPGPGQPPDRTFLSLDWRLRERWLLSATIGDRGTSLWDVLWHYRF